MRVFELLDRLSIRKKKIKKKKKFLNALKHLKRRSEAGAIVNGPTTTRPSLIYHLWKGKFRERIDYEKKVL
jgi:hypothetical protein